jgi:hypothetical protein
MDITDLGCQRAWSAEDRDDLGEVVKRARAVCTDSTAVVLGSL